VKSNLPREFVQSFNEQTVDGEPNRTTPVRVTAEQINVGLARQVIDRVHFVGLFERVWIFLVLLGHGTNAVGRQELVFFEQIVQHTHQAYIRKISLVPLIFLLHVSHLRSSLGTASK
jgi:hypothetical protein